MNKVKLLGAMFFAIGFCPALINEGGAQESAVPEAVLPQAAAMIAGTAEGSLITGTVEFYEEADGVRVEAQVANVPSGDHGFHVHEKGSCDDGGNAAGGHFNPHAAQHGMLSRDGHQAAHAGDLGNITVSEDGTGILSGKLPGVHITGGDVNIAGLAVILHEKADDFGQPTGNAGGRIGCGIITSTQ